MENNTQEISLIQLCKVAFGNKRRLVFFTAIVAVIGVLFFKFSYDPGKSEYVSDFNYFVKGLNEGQYIDGSAFKFEELVSYEALEAAKNSSEDFKNIDIDEMYHKNNITVKHVEKQNTNVNAPVEYLYYEIAVKSRFFTDGDQARAFISYLAEAPIAKTLSLSDADKYMINLKSFDGSESFEKQLDYLDAQVNYLDGKYSGLITYYGDIVLSDNDTLSDKKNDMDIYFVNNSISYLRYEQQENGYVLNKGHNIENLKLIKLDLEKTYKYNEMELDRLEKSIVSLMGSVASGIQTAEIDSYNSRITELISSNVNITKRIDDIDLQLKNINNSANGTFAQKLAEARSVLERYTASYQAVEYEVVKSDSKVFYENASIISANGGMGLVKGGIISVILGGFLACCINLVKGWRDIYEDPFKEETKKAKKATK